MALRLSLGAQQLRWAAGVGDWRRRDISGRSKAARVGCTSFGAPKIGARSAGVQVGGARLQKQRRRRCGEQKAWNGGLLGLGVGAGA